ncbi:hypothetical protein PSAB6_270009 [Paraburkholderia sabiae]|nr:hypothetical protein PSAB6_270009 [Paraburkholderia sabiae]
MEHIRSACFLCVCRRFDCDGMCSSLCPGFLRRARLTAGFLQSADVAAQWLKEPVPKRYPGGHRRFKSGFLLPTFLCRCKEK